MEIPIKYAKREYPEGIKPQIQEVAGHFDVPSIQPIMPFSLHTEYSYGRRKLSTDLLNEFETIRNSHHNSVPRLWFNKDWSKDFSKFVVKLVNGHPSPKIIEIHPPFNDYCNSIEQFLETYQIFEHKKYLYFSLVLSFY